MKRILMLNYEFPPLGGGAANATFYLLKELSQKDVVIDLVTSSVGRYKKEKFSSNITIHYLDIGKDGNLHYQSNKDLLKYSWKAYWYCKKLMMKKKYDLCHAFFGIPCGYIAMKLGLPYIVSLRGSDVPFYNKRFYWLDTLIFKRLSCKIWEKAEHVITNSEGLKKLALQPSPQQKISVIYNGVDTDEFKPKKDYTLSGTLNILSVGRLIGRKGYADLIRACKGLRVSITLVGDGPLKSELFLLADKLNVSLSLLGKKDHSELSSIYKSHDVFILPSYNEGMSNTVLEAMSSGLPLIVSDVGGTSELVSDNGFTFKPGNILELRKIIQKLSYKELIKMGKKSRKIAEMMSWNKVAEDYFNLY
ncbi:MAG: glycosyltransferase family 4 protein [Nanoarchaeota archaeon]